MAEKVKKYISRIRENPEAIIKEKVAERKKLPIVILAILAGIVISFTYTFIGKFGDVQPFSYIIPFWFIFGSFIGLAIIYIFGGILKMASDFFGGTADEMETRIALGWSFIPYAIIGLVVITISTLIYGLDLYTFELYSISRNSFFEAFYFFLMFLYIAGAMWSFSHLIDFLSFVNGYSKGKAFLSLLSSVIIFILIIKIFINILF